MTDIQKIEFVDGTVGVKREMKSWAVFSESDQSLKRLCTDQINGDQNVFGIPFPVNEVLIEKHWLTTGVEVWANAKWRVFLMVENNRLKYYLVDSNDESHWIARNTFSYALLFENYDEYFRAKEELEKELKDIEAEFHKYKKFLEWSKENSFISVENFKEILEERMKNLWLYSNRSVRIDTDNVNYARKGLETLKLELKAGKSLFANYSQVTKKIYQMLKLLEEENIRYVENLEFQYPNNYTDEYRNVMDFADIAWDNIDRSRMDQNTRECIAHVIKNISKKGHIMLLKKYRDFIDKTIKDFEVN